MRLFKNPRQVDLALFSAVKENIPTIVFEKSLSRKDFIVVENGINKIQKDLKDILAPHLYVKKSIKIRINDQEIIRDEVTIEYGKSRPYVSKAKITQINDKSIEHYGFKFSDKKEMFSLVAHFKNFKMPKEDIFKKQLVAKQELPKVLPTHIVTRQNLRPEMVISSADLIQKRILATQGKSVLKDQVSLKSAKSLINYAKLVDDNDRKKPLYNDRAERPERSKDPQYRETTRKIARGRFKNDIQDVTSQQKSGQNKNSTSSVAMSRSKMSNQRKKDQGGKSKLNDTNLDLAWDMFKFPGSTPCNGGRRRPVVAMNNRRPPPSNDKSNFTKNSNNVFTDTVQSIPPSVAKVVEREMNKNKGTENFDELLKSQQGSNYLDLLRERRDTGRESGTVLKAIIVNLDQGVTGSAGRFEFRPGYNLNKTVASDSTGEIDFTDNLNNKASVLNGSLATNGTMITAVDLDMSEEEMVVPLIDGSSMDKFMTHYKLQGNGGFLLIELNEDTLEVDVDSDFEAKIPLDENFKFNEKNRRYVLYVGLGPGSVTISYNLVNGISTQKIIFVEDDQGRIYFESNDFYKNDIETLELIEKGVLSKKRNVLDINQKYISFYHSDKKIKKRGLNKYELTNIYIPVGSRKYFELNHLSAPVMLGTWNTKSIEIPSEEYIAQVLQVNNIDELKHSCLIQFNVNKPIKDVQLSAYSKKGPAPFEHNFLDRNGFMSDEATPITDKIFFVGNQEGIVNVKVEYLDHSVEYLNSYCFTGNYLVENL